MHVSLVGLLRYVQKHYLPDLEVVDKGGYWETGDLEALRAARDFVTEKIDSVANAISEIKVRDAAMTEDSISDLIEEAIKKGMQSEKHRLQ
ncbi:hypothetical protein L0222_26145 [bacterium]|nr:hypothetical protein [bacterium]